MSETKQTEKGLTVNMPQHSAENGATYKETKNRMASNFNEAKAVTEQYKEVKSSVGLAGIDVRVEVPADDAISTFFFADNQPTYYISHNVHIPVKNHMWKTTDDGLKKYLRTHPRFGVDIFEGDMPKHIVEAIKKRKAESIKEGSQAYYDEEML